MFVANCYRTPTQCFTSAHGLRMSRASNGLGAQTPELHMARPGCERRWAQRGCARREAAGGGRGLTRGPGLPFGSNEGFRGFEFAYFPAHRAWKTRLCIFFSTQSAENSTLHIFLNTERRKLEFRFFLQRRASKTRLCILVFF